MRSRVTRNQSGLDSSSISGVSSLSKPDCTGAQHVYVYTMVIRMYIGQYMGLSGWKGIYKM
jgi:hypothetical protein